MSTSIIPSQRILELVGGLFSFSLSGSFISLFLFSAERSGGFRLSERCIFLFSRFGSLFHFSVLPRSRSCLFLLLQV